VEFGKEKQKKLLILALTTLSVYLLFRYLLPLVLPFLVAWLLARLIRPVVRWLHEKCRIPLSVGSVVLLVLVIGILGFALWKLIEVLFMQGMILLQKLPEYLTKGQEWLEQFCGYMERQMRLTDGMLVDGARTMLENAGTKVQEFLLNLAISSPMPILQYLITGGVVLAFILMAAVLVITGEDKRKEKEYFMKAELSQIGKSLGEIGKCYFKCEVLVVLLTCVICVGGLWIMGNPYAFLIGMIIGLLDALPLFGTGTILIPWGIIELIQGNIKNGIILLIIYIVSYFLREILETKFLCNSIGSSPLATLVAMYVGLELFGILGLLLGPIGWLLIQEILKLLDKGKEDLNVAAGS